MNVLYLSLLLPYPMDSGSKFRTYFLLRYLSSRHKITLLTFTRKTDRLDSIKHMETFCKETIPIPLERKKTMEIFYLSRSFFKRIPFFVLRTWRSEFMAKVKELLSTRCFDVIHVDHLCMASYALAAKESQKSDLRTVLEESNAEFMLYRRMAKNSKFPMAKLFLSLEAHRLARYEQMICNQFDCIVTVTSRDRQLLLGQAGENAKDRLVAIPTCTDPENIPLVDFQPGKPNILHVGSLSWPPNLEGALWFIEKVLPIVSEKIPEVKFIIVGSNPPGKIRALHAKGSVIVPGYANDINLYFSKSGVFVVPIKTGSGMRVKIIDAWVRGLPIVSTTIGAEGLMCTEGKDILIADTPKTFADAVIDVIRNKELAMSLRTNGRILVENNYNWKTIYKAYDDIYEKTFSKNVVKKS